MSSIDIANISQCREESDRMRRCAGWLPESPFVRREFLRKHHEQVKTRMRCRAEYTPSVARFEAAIKADPVMVPLVEQVLLQASAREPCIPDSEIETVDQLLYYMDIVVTQAPLFCSANDEDGNVIGVEPVGCPMSLLLEPLSNTEAAYNLFRMPAFNIAMKDLLNTWGEYLTTPSSAKVLTDSPEGWFSPAALQMLGEGRGNFDETYILPDPRAADKGFKSWDAFFTREFQPDARPIAGKGDPTLIHNACEGTVFNIAHNVKLHDNFWLKGQPYSLYDMLDKRDYARHFVGGTVYQAFLSPQDYHRWHAPLNGTVVQTANIPGTYFAALPVGNRGNALLGLGPN